MVLEDGMLVHKSEADGQWSITNHPLNNMGKYLRGKSGDPFPIDNPRPDRNWAAFMSYPAEVRFPSNAVINFTPVKRYPSASVSMVSSSSLTVLTKYSSAINFSSTAALEIDEDSTRSGELFMTSTATFRSRLIFKVTKTFNSTASAAYAAKKRAPGVVSFSSSASLSVAEDEEFRATIGFSSTATLVSDGTKYAVLPMVNGAIIRTPGLGQRQVPPGVTSISIEVWGNGGNGASGPGTGASGGGGGYSKRTTKSVVPGSYVGFAIQVGGSNQPSTCDGMSSNAGTSAPDRNTAGTGGGTGGVNPGDIRLSGYAGTVTAGAAGGNAGDGSLGATASTVAEVGGGGAGVSTSIYKAGSAGGVRFTW